MALTTAYEATCRISFPFTLLQEDDLPSDDRPPIDIALPGDFVRFKLSI